MTRARPGPPEDPPARPARHPARPGKDPERALAYPYDVPDRSYVIHAGKVRVVTSSPDLGDLKDRTAVLAVGSNQSPRALAWKFADPADGHVPVQRIHLTGFDSVYSAHFAGYGSVPATLHTAPGTVVTLFVNWLTPTQLSQMHGTEVGAGNYAYGELTDFEAKVDVGPRPDRLGLYLSTRGALSIDGAPVPLAETPAKNRPWRARTQRQVMTHLRDRFAHGGAVEDFVQHLIDDRRARQGKSRDLRQGAHRFDHPGFRPVG